MPSTNVLRTIPWIITTFLDTDVARGDGTHTKSKDNIKLLAQWIYIYNKVAPRGRGRDWSGHAAGTRHTRILYLVWVDRYLFNVLHTYFRSGSKFGTHDRHVITLAIEITDSCIAVQFGSQTPYVRIRRLFVFVYFWQYGTPSWLLKCNSSCSVHCFLFWMLIGYLFSLTTPTHWKTKSWTDTVDIRVYDTRSTNWDMVIRLVSSTRFECWQNAASR